MSLVIATPTTIANDSVLVPFGAGVAECPAQLKFCDIMYFQPIVVGLTIQKPDPCTVRGFHAVEDPGTIEFFNVAEFVEPIPIGEAEGTLLFFNVGEQLPTLNGEADDTILFFNVAEDGTFVEGEADGTLLFFNVAESTCECA
jgi:hypothetical protein